ncbi:helix-turn-helix domain-containing protein [Deinococcus daejeonensis]|nr:helix-turn-helix domain-containing protein [Deinococcus daejeonensis]
MTQPRTRLKAREIPAWATALRVRRTQLGLSQEGVAAASDDGISQKAVSDLETGRVHLTDMALGRVVALAKALNWSLAEMQRATGVDLGITPVTLVGEGSADVYPLTAALTLDNPGPAIDHELVTPGLKRPLLLRMDSEEMLGVTSASIRPGSTLHIDQADTTPEEGRVYVLTDQDGAHVRLYTTTRLGPVFRAENRTFEDIPATEATIIGRVVSVATDYDPNLN